MVTSKDTLQSTGPVSPPNSLYTGQALLQSCLLKEMLKNTLVCGIGLTWKETLPFQPSILLGMKRRFWGSCLGWAVPNTLMSPSRRAHLHFAEEIKIKSPRDLSLVIELDYLRKVFRPKLSKAWHLHVPPGDNGERLCGFLVIPSLHVP